VRLRREAPGRVQRTSESIERRGFGFRTDATEKTAKVIGGRPHRAVLPGRKTHTPSYQDDRGLVSPEIGPHDFNGQPLGSAPEPLEIALVNSSPDASSSARETREPRREPPGFYRDGNSAVKQQAARFLQRARQNRAPAHRPRWRRKNHVDG
jgi:hypothetical protein